jgi:hypothetical protein
MTFRKIPRDVHEDARDAARALMATPEFNKSRSDRKRVEMREPDSPFPFYRAPSLSHLPGYRSRRLFQSASQPSVARALRIAKFARS